MRAEHFQRRQIPDAFKYARKVGAPHQPFRSEGIVQTTKRRECILVRVWQLRFMGLGC